MTSIFAKRALGPDGWMHNVRLTCDTGHIRSIVAGVAPTTGDTVVDTLLPALSNLHSHSFQRAMAGMTETRAAGQDSFWTWRTLMYRFMDHLTPDQIETIAALVFMEMQETGYAAVGEFHYVHHQPGGRRYDRLNELGDRVFAAASQTRSKRLERQSRNSKRKWDGFRSGFGRNSRKRGFGNFYIRSRRTRELE